MNEGPESLPHGIKERLTRDLELRQKTAIPSRLEFKEYQTTTETAEITRETIGKFFEQVPNITADPVCRPKGETTIFTTAGVQKIETIQREKGMLEKSVFRCVQPVIRSQYMDSVKEGSSTAFLNCTFVEVDATQAAYAEASRQFVDYLLAANIPAERLSFVIEEGEEKWGPKSFHRTILRVYLDEIGIGDCIYLQNYPDGNQRHAITDIGFGVERLAWAIDSSKKYLPDFQSFYDLYPHMSTDEVAQIIDPIRSMVLIAAEGIKASNKEHGYRFRQFSKRFVQRNKHAKLSAEDIINTALTYWRSWNFVPKISDHEIIVAINIENERNTNAEILSELNKTLSKGIIIDINQSTADFIKQLKFSLPETISSSIVKQFV